MSLVKSLIKCQCCNNIKCITMTTDSIISYENGALVQDAFDYLSADDRELIISRTCSDCWNKLFGEDSQEEDQAA